MLRSPLGVAQAALPVRLTVGIPCGHILRAYHTMLRLRKQYFFEFFEFLLKMRTYDLIQPKSNCSDRNLIIRATRGAHPMAVRTRRSAKMSTFFGSGQMRK